MLLACNGSSPSPVILPVSLISGTIMAREAQKPEAGALLGSGVACGVAAVWRLPHPTNDLLKWATHHEASVAICEAQGWRHDQTKCINQGDLGESLVLHLI